MYCISFEIEPYILLAGLIVVLTQIKCFLNSHFMIFIDLFYFRKSLQDCLQFYWFVCKSTRQKKLKEVSAGNNLNI